MKYSTLISLASAMAGLVSANSCTDANGYYYCDETSKFIYKNVGFSGSYSNVVSMNEDNTDVSYATSSFSGPLAPFDEELSVHVRGPINLQEFAVYYPASGALNKKRDTDAEEECSTTQILHHKHVKRATKVVTQTMYVNQNGEAITQTVAINPTSAASVQDNFAPSAAPAAGSSSASVASPASGSASGSPAGSAAASSAASESTAAASSAASESTAAASSAASESTAAASSAASESTASASAGDWVRTSHYVPGSTTNLTVLNNYGGAGSGVWSPTWGLSLSYANSDNSGGASSATPLGDVTLKSISEFSLWSGLECGDSSEEYDCGYYRPGSVAMHAFAGAEKIMVFSFKMPSDTSTGSQTGTDMPAIWLLNAKVPRIGQYLGISCWKSGCGELDLFEVLVNDYNKMVTALHDKQGGNGGGSSDYIARPYDSVMKAVVIFYAGEIHVQVVDSDYEFGSTLSSSQVSTWRAVSGSEITLSS